MAANGNRESPGARERGPRTTGPSRARRAAQYAPFSSLLGIAAGLGVDQADETDKAFRLSVVTGQELLAGSAALGAAFGAIVIAVLALVSVWFDQTYLDVLEERGGWDYAMRPFRVTGTVSVLTTLVAIVGIFTFNPAGLVFRALILGITGGLLTWSIFGTLVIVSLLFEHGHDRAELKFDLERGEVRHRILGLQGQVEAKKLTFEEFQRQRAQLLQTLNPRQQKLLLDELNALSPPLQS